jgi:hypothetical protein
MIVSKWFLPLILAFVFTACDEEQKADQKHPDIYNEVGDDDDDDDDTGTTTVVNTSSDVFQTWCTKAAETEIIKNRLQTSYGYLCQDGQPTELFKSSLPSRAYQGEGAKSFNLKLLTEPAHDNDTARTTMTIGTAILLPIELKTHFDAVGPKNGEAESLEKAAIDQGATAEVVMLGTTTETGGYHVRGFNYTIHSVKMVFGGLVKVESDSNVQADHWKFEDSNSYMYTSYYTEEGTGIYDNSILTAGVKIGEQSFLISIGYVVADNKSLPSVAVDTIKETAQIIGDTNYKAALTAKQ